MLSGATETINHAQLQDIGLVGGLHQLHVVDMLSKQKQTELLHHNIAVLVEGQCCHGIQARLFSDLFQLCVRHISLL